MSTSPAVSKDASQVRQKQMIADHYHRLAITPETGEKNAYTFVPGNLTELLLSFDLLPVLPEINSLQSAMRGKTAEYISIAEKHAHSEDVCTYVKSDIGMLKSGNIGPTGQRLPDPDVLLLSYTGCFTFMKWFELLREEYKAPVAMLHTPYQGDGMISAHMRHYMVKQLREMLARSREAENDLVAVLESAKHRPSPIDAYFGGVYYIGPIFSAFRGTPEGADYYRILKEEVRSRLDAGRGPITPEGPMADERFRLVVEGPPNWTSFREVWNM